MTKTEAIKAMMNGEVCVSNNFVVRFHNNKFERKDHDPVNKWVNDNVNLYSNKGWSIHTPPKETKKHWQWVLKNRATGKILTSNVFFPDERSVVAYHVGYTVIKRLDGTNGTWDSCVELEVE